MEKILGPKRVQGQALTLVVLSLLSCRGIPTTAAALPAKSVGLPAGPEEVAVPNPHSQPQRSMHNGGKPGAPVEVTGDIHETLATVRVNFGRPMDDCTIQFRGVDGLVVVEGLASEVRGNYPAGEAVFSVPLSAAPPGGRLVVGVSGNAMGHRTGRVSALVVPGATPLSLSKPMPGTARLIGGRRVHVLPAQSR